MAEAKELVLVNTVTRCLSLTKKLRFLPRRSEKVKHGTVDDHHYEADKEFDRRVEPTPIMPTYNGPTFIGH